MARTKTIPGRCAWCMEEVPQNTHSILSHIKKCPEYPGKPGGANSSLLLIQNAYGHDFWMVVKVKPFVTLKKLDQFLRAIWLECCGHMSEFTDGGAPVAMKHQVIEAIGPGETLEYEYDFGSSTNLEISLFGTIADSERQEIQVMVRNIMPEAKCDSCGGHAELICQNCQEEKTVLCKKCTPKHECVVEEGDDYMLSPISNSPRAGVCGYTGPDEQYIKKYFPKEIV